MTWPQIESFQVRFANGSIINHPISEFHLVNSHILRYGRASIAKISFYFITRNHQFHNLILRNTEHNDRFVLEFCHYYDQNNRPVELSMEQKLADYQSVMNIIIHTSNLDDRLGQFIINPFEPEHYITM
jgi:hypothetical protein